jgi:hypothetical protein
MLRVGTEFHARRAGKAAAASRTSGLLGKRLDEASTLPMCAAEAAGACAARRASASRWSQATEQANTCKQRPVGATRAARAELGCRPAARREAGKAGRSALPGGGATRVNPAVRPKFSGWSSRRGSVRR